MGRQILIATAPADEKLFLTFLRQTADIALIERFAKTKRDLWQDNFAEEPNGHWSYNIWNRAFPWKPEYGRTHVPDHPERHGLYYVANTNDAPVIQFVRSSIDTENFGRIYWAKDFAAPMGLHYDVAKFTEWYESIVKWVRKNTAGKIKNGRVTHFLPDASRVYTEKRTLNNLAK